LRDHRSSTGSRSGSRKCLMRSAPGRFMFGASAASRSVTFSSFAVSFSWVPASHCCRCPFSCQTARQRPISSRAGYTVMPYSSSMTSPPPRVAARPVPFARTRPGAVRPGFARRAGRATLQAGCGDSVGILKIAAGTSVMPVPSLPAFPQAGGLTTETPYGWSGAGSNCRPSAFQVNCAKRCADLQKRTSLTSGSVLGGRCRIYASRF